MNPCTGYPLCNVSVSAYEPFSTFQMFDIYLLKLCNTTGLSVFSKMYLFLNVLVIDKERKLVFFLVLFSIQELFL